MTKRDAEQLIFDVWTAHANADAVSATTPKMMDVMASVLQSKSGGKAEQVTQVRHVLHMERHRGVPEAASTAGVAAL
jgi:hypothetical protein